MPKTKIKAKKPVRNIPRRKPAKRVVIKRKTTARKMRKAVRKAVGKAAKRIMRKRAPIRKAIRKAVRKAIKKAKQVPKPIYSWTDSEEE